MKKIMTFAVCAMLAMTASAQKFGNINMGEVFETMPERAVVQKEMEELQAKYETELSKMGDEYQKKVNDYLAEQEKLEKNLGGIKEMKRLPDAIFVVDPKKEQICIREAEALGLTIIGIADTNCDPDELDFVIPGNDDAIRAVKLIVSKMADAVVEANQGEEAGAAAEESAEADAE